MAGADTMQKMLPETQPKRKHPLHPLCARTAFSCNKLLLFIYALLFMFVGIVLIAIGVNVELLRNRIESLNNKLAVPTALLIVMGLFIAFNSLCGMIGTFLEKPLLLKVFLVTTIVCFLVQVTIGIIAFIFRQELPNVMSSELMFAVKGYSERSDIKEAMDWLQLKYECCGFNSYRDYRTESEYFGCGGEGKCGVPWSCCAKKEGLTTMPLKCGDGIFEKEESRIMDDVNVQGCTTNFIRWLMDHLDLVGAIALGFAIPQIFGILLSYYFLRKVKEYRVWYRVDNFRN